MATILPPRGDIIEPSELEAAVGSSGFQLLWTEFEVLGELSEGPQPGGQGMALFALDTEQRFLILPGKEDAERQTYARLGEWADEPGQLVRVHGRLSRGNASSATLRLQEYSVE